MTLTITSLKAREILDSRGNPTIEAELFLSNHQSVVASVPSGASTGKHEAVELRDKDPNRYAGKGVLKALQHIESLIAPGLLGKDPTQQKSIDEWMIALDQTHNKSHLGANAMLAVSLAVAKAGALSRQQTFHDYLSEGHVQSLPVPLMNVINGGAHADNGLNFQEFMIMPVGFENFAHALRCGVEIFHVLKSILASKKLSTSVGDEGGFAPHLSSHAAALDLLAEAIHKAGYRLGEEVFLALDVASSEFYQDAHYHLSNENLVLDSAGMVNYLKKLVEAYPIISIEDGLAEDDWAGWNLLTQTLGERVQLVGDDLFVTNTQLLEKGIQTHAANAILIKPNQIGTVTETIAAIGMAKAANFGTIISHRSGETEDTSIADIAVGLNALQIKTGSLSRTDRLAKYNQLLRIAAENPKMSYAGDALRKHLNLLS